jgi:uncharacterized protein (UPF0548 family)
MVRTHGVLNSIGFVLLGVIGWRARRRPTPETQGSAARVERVLARACASPADAELLLDFDTAPPGFRRGSTRAVVGRGRADYARATQLISAWAFLPHWMHTHPVRVPQETGRSLVVVANTLGVRWLLPTRILTSLTDDDGVTIGFVYGALPGHIARGYERFVASFDTTTGAVVFDITAVARITKPVLRPVAPLFPLVQWYFRRAAMRRLRASVIRMATERALVRVDG